MANFDMLKYTCNRKHARCLPCLRVRFLAVSVIRIKIKGANMKNKAKVFTLALLVVALFTALMLSACGKTDDKTPDDGVKTYTVTFVTDGGTAVPPQTISEGGKVVKPADPKKTAIISGKVIDYEFEGWYSGETMWDFETITISADTVLTAKWKQDYTPPYLPKN